MISTDITTLLLFLLILLNSVIEVKTADGTAYGLITRHQTECELESLSVGTKLADSYNSLDEDTDWDVRIHEDYLVERLGFASWIQAGVSRSGRTPLNQNAKDLHTKGGWIGHSSIRNSSYWALEDQWLYMVGDSTQRQVWAIYVSPFQNNNFERNAKEWTRDKCARQFPHRMEHPSGGNFPEEGWSGKCGNNEVTCDLSGFGPEGKISYDWKHFTYEDYDEWLFGDTGKWSNDSTVRRPDILAVEFGIHTCMHAFNTSTKTLNETTVKRHEEDIPIFMQAVRTAVDRHNTTSGVKTLVIVSTAGRTGNDEYLQDICIWRFNRILAHEAHKQGFAVLEREEIERRLLFKGEHYIPTRNMKPNLHLESPAPNIIATALLTLISCLKKNESSTFIDAKSSSLQAPDP